MTASVIGISTSCPKYSAATTSVPTATPASVFSSGADTGRTCAAPGVSEGVSRLPVTTSL
jgi:hypothetical protein